MFDWHANARTQRTIQYYIHLYLYVNDRLRASHTLYLERTKQRMREEFNSRNGMLAKFHREIQSRLNSFLRTAMMMIKSHS